MNNPSLAEKSSGNGHVSLSGKYVLVYMSLSTVALYIQCMLTTQDFNRKHHTVIIMQVICVLLSDIIIICRVHKVTCSLTLQALT